MANQGLLHHQPATLWTWVRHPLPTVAPLRPLRRWLDGITPHSPAQAHRLAALIPAQCPFERDVVLFGRVVAHIPPLCKLNPFYNELVALRFRTLCYLADDCGEDISAYI